MDYEQFAAPTSQALASSDAVIADTTIDPSVVFLAFLTVLARLRRTVSHRLPLPSPILLAGANRAASVGIPRGGPGAELGAA